MSVIHHLIDWANKHTGIVDEKPRGFDVYFAGSYADCRVSVLVEDHDPFRFDVAVCTVAHGDPVRWADGEVVQRFVSADRVKRIVEYVGEHVTLPEPLDIP